MSVRLVVGLGNPGNRYVSTRHNVGFDVASAFVEQASREIHPQLKLITTWVTKDDCELAEVKLHQDKVTVIKPLVFMNNSGAPVSRIAQFYKIPVQDIAVINDELDLPLGTVRLKQGGGEAGHNGLRSISERLGSKDYIRVRIGIGRPHFEGAPIENEGAVTSWVLEKFKADEKPIVANSIATAVEALIELGINGLKIAQNRYNC